MSDNKKTMSGPPTSFVAVFYDDEGEVQIGANNMPFNDYAEWAAMLRVAAEKLELQHLLRVRDHMMQQRGGGLILPKE